MRLVLVPLLLLLGAASGVAAVAVHGWWWGFALAAAAVLATLVALPPGWSTRLPYAVGFGLVVGRLAVARAEGDFMVAGDLRGYLVLLLTLVVGVVAVATLPRPGGRRRPGEPVPNPRMSGDED